MKNIKTILSAILFTCAVCLIVGFPLPFLPRPLIRLSLQPQRPPNQNIHLTLKIMLLIITRKNKLICKSQEFSNCCIPGSY